ncbi:MAG: GNAT family N-acetyltransferase [Lachnospiraceae bacterium]|nr:GNAT family N-acetyltransferase [Lachnospiraceae bacterium]
MDYNIVPITDGDDEFIEDKLVEYNLSMEPATQGKLFESISRKIVDEEGNIIAGCLAIMYCWNVVAIDIIWVDEQYRGQGLGSMLLGEVEREAMEKGCHLVHLDTFDFQAKGFYEKNGYSVFGILEDCPKGHIRYYLKKTL